MAVLMLLYLPSYTAMSEMMGAIAASHTIERFCRNRRLYSGNGKVRGETAQYDIKATPSVANVIFCTESKEILDDAPAISTGESSFSNSQYGPSALIGPIACMGMGGINGAGGDITEDCTVICCVLVEVDVGLTTTSFFACPIEFSFDSTGGCNGVSSVTDGAVLSFTSASVD